MLNLLIKILKYHLINLSLIIYSNLQLVLWIYKVHLMAYLLLKHHKIFFYKKPLIIITILLSFPNILLLKVFFTLYNIIRLNESFIMIILHNLMLIYKDFFLLPNCPFYSQKNLLMKFLLIITILILYVIHFHICYLVPLNVLSQDLIL